MNAQNTVIHVVDDDLSVRRSLQRLFRSAGFAVEAYDSANAFLEKAEEDVCGCLVLDVKMPGMSGLALQEHLGKRELSLPIVFITGHGDIPMSVRTIKKGAVDFLTKPFDDHELLDSVQEALSRNREERQKQAERLEARERLATLSPRERDVFGLVVEGLLNKQVAARLGITEKTVKAHRGKVMEKTGVHSFAELVRLSERLSSD